MTQRSSSERGGLDAPPFHAGAAGMLTPALATLLSDEVVDRLRDSILKGYFAPGDRLREEQLAEALGVSRGPVRNALVQLEREGLAVRRPNRGAVVAELSRSDLEEVFSLRLAIEPVGCAWAARHADEEDLAQMQKIVDGYSKLTTKVNVRQAAESDLAFHDIVYRASRHRRLIRLWDDLRPQVYVFLLARTYVHKREFRDIMMADHGALLAVIGGGDENEAYRTSAEHVRASYLRVVENYDSGSEARGLSFGEQSAGSVLAGVRSRR
jgi:DNA-binding GntR family transcriptional regulator